MEPNLLIVVISTYMTVTSYQPTPAQTKPECRNRYDCTTSIDDGVTMYGCAASQDLLKSGIVKYGDVLSVPGLGLRVVNDAMGPTKCVRRNKAGHCVKRVPQRNAIDLMVFSYEEEHRVGVRHLPITRIRQAKPDDLPGMRE
jgi:hypothetical protein